MATKKQTTTKTATPDFFDITDHDRANDVILVNVFPEGDISAEERNRTITRLTIPPDIFSRETARDELAEQDLYGAYRLRRNIGRRNYLQTVIHVAAPEAAPEPVTVGIDPAIALVLNELRTQLTVANERNAMYEKKIDDMRELFLNVNDERKRDAIEMRKAEAEARVIEARAERLQKQTEVDIEERKAQIEIMRKENDAPAQTSILADLAKKIIENPEQIGNILASFASGGVPPNTQPQPQPEAYTEEEVLAAAESIRNRRSEEAAQPQPAPEPEGVAQ